MQSHIYKTGRRHSRHRLKDNLGIMLQLNGKTDNKRISSLDGLKAIMMLSIFCWHTPPNPASPLGEPAADLGARACEVLFVASGFLIGYRHYDRLITASLKRTWDYVSAKVARVWPVHFIAFLIISVYLAYSDPHAFFSLSTACD